MSILQLRLSVSALLVHERVSGRPLWEAVGPQFRLRIIIVLGLLIVLGAASHRELHLSFGQLVSDLGDVG